MRIAAPFAAALCLVGAPLVHAQEDDEEIVLVPDDDFVYEAVVTGETEDPAPTRHTITRRQMTSVPGTFGDPLRVIQNLPGMARSPYVTGLLLVRGTNPDDTGVFIDEHEVPLLYHFLGGPSILNPEFLDEIDLYPGGFPARFGRQTGGVVAVSTRRAVDDGFHGSAEIDVIDSGAYARFAVTDDVTLSLSGRRSYVDALLPFVLPDPDPGDQLVVVPVYWDYQARMDVALGGGQKLSVLLLGSDDRLDVLQVDAEDEETFDLGLHIGFHRLQARYQRPIGGGLSLLLTPAVGIDLVTAAAGERSAADIRQTVFSLRERVFGELAPDVTMDVGLDLEMRLRRFDLLAQFEDEVDSATGEDPNLPVEELVRTVESYAVGVHGQLVWDVGRLQLMPGLRVDAYSLAGQSRLSLDPRLAARYRISEETALKAYAGLFHQPPEAEGLDRRFGNPELSIERALHTGLGIEQQLVPAVRLEAELYYLDRRRLANFTGETVRRDDGTLMPLTFVSRGQSRSFGLELLLRHDITPKFYGWVSYTLSRSLQKRARDDEFTLGPWDQTHNFIAVASRRLGRGFEVGVRLRLTTGRPQTPIVGSVYDADEDEYDAIRGERLGDRRAFFHQLDIRAEKTWSGDWWDLSVYLDVLNVYNAENPEATQYDYRLRESAPVRGLPFVPTLGIKGAW